MPRKARAVAVDVPHHVTQRGNGRRDVFFSERDRQVYLDTFFDYAARYSLRVWGYCLMRNHVHFVAGPQHEHSLARVFGRTHSDFARYANLVRRSCGHFWQARFYSCAMEGQHAWNALAYVERNPLRAGLLNTAQDYPWSSAAAHCHDDDLQGRLELAEWRNNFTAERWQAVLRMGLAEEAWQDRLREATRRGTPLGSNLFVDQLSRMLGRDLRSRPPGRPPKQQALATAAFVKG